MGVNSCGMGVITGRLTGKLEWKVATRIISPINVPYQLQK